MLDYSKSFIEMQFPVSKVSKESYKERKANLGQTLTGLGKWWGRKPLILVRAALLGVLLPVSDDPLKDRDVFLKILTMDQEGLLLRKEKNLSVKEIYKLLTDKERAKFYSVEPTEDAPAYRSGITRAEKNYLQQLTFNRLSYDEKLTYCCRPEHIDNLPKTTWDEVNAHLCTAASSFSELVRQLGEKRYGHTPRVGDCFAGGGSIPFESARMGANVYASDLNPIAALLTWSALNIAGASNEEVEKLRVFQQMVYDQVDAQITQWQIEHNEQGDRADSYLYCHESKCPECGYKVPLAPSWVIGKGTKTVAFLEDNGHDGFSIHIIQGASQSEFAKAESVITIRDTNMYCPHCKRETPIAVVRGERQDSEGNTISGLRKWEKTDFIPRADDVFQERLYCIRYVRKYPGANGEIKSERYYRSPMKVDFERESKVILLLSERFEEWQDKGFIPSVQIEEGDETSRLQRERGWLYWHQLFNPRQLLVHGLIAKTIIEKADTIKEMALGMLGINKCCDWSSKLARWDSAQASEKGAQTFSNQALNSIYNYSTRTMLSLATSWYFNINNHNFDIIPEAASLRDAREVNEVCDIWITDPPYADAVNYHELTEYFLAWNSRLIEMAFPNWYSDSKRVLAVKGTGDSFNKSMIDIYSNLASHIPENGTQIVMFTHQDVKVWAELAMILWTSGLRVVSAWNIATETESGGLKKGNYVKGTVLLELKKQTSNEVAFQDEIYSKIRREVQLQIESMRSLDDKEDPNFNDADYLLASYASSLKVLTAYRNIEGIDVEYELSKARDSKEINPIEEIIKKAIKIAYDYLIPDGIEQIVWRDLTPEERFIIRGLELEMSNVHHISAYQELARGFGVTDYQDMFENMRANTARLKTASELRARGTNNNDAFGRSLLRHVLLAIYQCVQTESTAEGKNYLKATYDHGNEYWSKRNAMIAILEFISRFENIADMDHWYRDSHYARLLKEFIRNDGI